MAAHHDISIQAVLAKRNARMDRGRSIHLAEVETRANLTERIARDYARFYPLRRKLTGKGVVHQDLETDEQEILDVLIAHELLDERDGRWQIASSVAARYIRGQWLEEWTALEALKAGAEEVVAGQEIVWKAGGIEGRNEVDCIARFGETLLFCSCKSLSPKFISRKQEHRERLMSALHEADNLADHFGRSHDLVMLVVASDLYDEEADAPVYQNLYGKAHALNVAVIDLSIIAEGNLAGRMVDELARLRQNRS